MSAVPVSMTMSSMAGAMVVTAHCRLMQMVKQNTTVTNTAPKQGKRHQQGQTREGVEGGRTPACAKASTMKRMSTVSSVRAMRSADMRCSCAVI